MITRVLALTAAVLATHDSPRTDMFRVYRLTPKTEEQLEYLTKLYNMETELDVDFWKAPHAVDAPADVMVQDTEMDRWLVDQLITRQIPYEITISDVAKLVQQRKAEHDIHKEFDFRRRKRAATAYYDIDSYGTYQEMIDYMKALEREQPGLVRLQTIGERTVDGNYLYMIKIGKPARGNRIKRAFWIDGGIHAREWAAPHVVMYFIQKLVTEYKTDSTIRYYVDNLDFYLLPVVNPDGYTYSMSDNSPRVRLWRKNRSPTSSQRCRGVDLNRNFDFHWGESGSSKNPCSEVYQGTSAFSEVETRAIRDVLLGKLKGQVDGLITLHTYSQIWIHPYGHQRHEYPADRDDLYKVGKDSAKALSKKYRTQYKVGSGADALYPASGGSDDWSKSAAGIKYVYLLELRPDEYHWDGFILQENQLIPTSKETWDGIAVVIDAVLTHNNIALPQDSQTSPASTSDPFGNKNPFLVKSEGALDVFANAERGTQSLNR